MLSRFISKPSNIRLIALISTQSHISNYIHHPPISNPSSSFHFPPTTSRYFSSNNNNKGSSNFWKLSSDNDENVFGEETGSLEGFVEGKDGNVFAKSDEESKSWMSVSKKEKENGADDEHDIFKGIDDNGSIKDVGIDDNWASGEGYKDWNFVVGEDSKDEDDVFDIGNEGVTELSGFDVDEKVDSRKKEEEKKLEIEEKALSDVLKGSDRAFGDLIASSGITEEMLDSLMALKDLDDVPGLPPLSEIEDMRYEKNTRKSTRAEIERQKQEEIAKSRVRQVDSKGRAYGTGKRKCSIARVWIQPGEGKFIINDKQFDAYFPMLDHRAALLRPFSETKTLGLMDVSCTVKGGGVSGQVGAIRLGISRALQNWAPDELRPPLKEAGFLTRDSRVVERKKPGKAKARKSFQWVKR